MSGTLSIGDKTVLSHDTNTDVVTLGNATTASTLNIKPSINASGDAPIYACRAWVNFNGIGTIAIRDSGNVSSITDRGIGVYDINFQTAMADQNYAIAGMASNTTDGWSLDSTGAVRGPIGIFQNGTDQPSTTFCRVQTRFGSTSSSDGNNIDFSQATVAIFR